MTPIQYTDDESGEKIKNTIKPDTFIKAPHGLYLGKNSHVIAVKSGDYVGLDEDGEICNWRKV